MKSATAWLIMAGSAAAITLGSVAYDACAERPAPPPEAAAIPCDQTGVLKVYQERNGAWMFELIDGSTGPVPNGDIIAFCGGVR